MIYWYVFVPFSFLFDCRLSCCGVKVRRGIDVTSEKVKVLPPGRRCEVRGRCGLGRAGSGNEME